MKIIQKGFTLIELMIVIAIIGILAIIALPKYQDFSGRAQVTEAINLAEGQKAAVMEYYINKGTWPANNGEAGIADKDKITGNYVASVEVSAQGVITATMKNEGVSNDVAGKTLTLTPTPKDGSFTWACAGTLNSKLLPPSCRSEKK